MPNRGFSKIPLENDNITMREIMDKLLERRKMKYRGKNLWNDVKLTVVVN